MEQRETNLAVAQGLNDLFKWFVALKPNNRTKLPSVNINQDEAIGVVKHINYIASIVGFQNRIETDEEGNVVGVVLEEIKLPETTDEALEEIVELTKEIGQEL